MSETMKLGAGGVVARSGLLLLLPPLVMLVLLAPALLPRHLAPAGSLGEPDRERWAGKELDSNPAKYSSAPAMRRLQAPHVPPHRLPPPSPPPPPSPTSRPPTLPPPPQPVGLACAPAEAQWMTGAMESDAIFCSVLLCLSGLFSGLTLGLMSLTVSDLEIYIQSEKPDEDAEDYQERIDEALNAQKILPMRQRGNLLLCTLLLGNTLVNALIAILSANFTSGAVGAALSTFFIVIFGEITPQSVFMFFLCPVAYPISRVLDCVLGEEMGMAYDKQELAQLVDQQEKNQESNVDASTTNLLKGALTFGQKTVKDIMTTRTVHAQATADGNPGTWMLDIGKKLDFDTMLAIYKTGYTRIPICDGSETDPQSPIVGLLLTKDLMLVDPEDEIEIRLLLSFCGRNITPISENERLDKMLGMLTSTETKTHLFFVQPDEEYQKGAHMLEPTDLRLSIVEDLQEIGDQHSREDAQAPGMDPQLEEEQQGGQSTAQWRTEEAPDLESGGGGGVGVRSRSASDPSGAGPTSGWGRRGGGMQVGRSAEYAQVELTKQLIKLSISELFMRGRADGMREEKLAKHLDSKPALVEMIVAFETSIDRGERRPLHGVIGIVTIEDLLEELIQAEIQDETDIFVDNESRAVINRGRKEQKQMDAREEFFKHMVDPKRSKLKRSSNLSHEETVVLVDFLQLHVTSFRDYCPVQGGEQEKRRRMKELVRAASIEEHKPEEEGQLVPQLFVRDQPCDHCVLVLTGRLQVVATTDNFVSEAGPYRILGADALTNPRYRPSFSTAVLEETRLIRIRRSQYMQMVDGRPITDFKAQTASEAARAGEQAASASPRNRPANPHNNTAVRRRGSTSSLFTRSESSGNLKFAAVQSRVQRRFSATALQDEAAADAAVDAAAHETTAVVDNPLSSAGTSMVEQSSSFEGGSDSSPDGEKKRLRGRLQKISSPDVHDDEVQSGDVSQTLSPLQLGEPARAPSRRPLTLNAEAEEEV